ncbi:TATA-binding protein-associated phosphoprotein [Entamoeba marina]
MKHAMFKRECHKKQHNECKCYYSFKDVRNYQTEQECVYLALLSQYFDIIIQAPNKRCVVTSPFFRMLSVSSGNDVIGINDFINNRVTERLGIEIESGVSRKTALRRSETYKITETLHILMDLLLEFNHFFQTRLTTGKKGTTKTETTYKIFSNGKFVMGQDEISKRGKLINNFISSLDVNDGVVCIKKNDHNMNMLLHQQLH